MLCGLLLLNGLGRQLTDTIVEYRSLPPSLSWAGTGGEGNRGAKGGEGPARGGELWRGVSPNAHAVPHVLLPRAPTGRLGRQLTDTLVEASFPGPFALLGR